MKKALPLRTRLFFNTLAIVLVGMGLAALLAWRAVEGLYLATQRENLLAQANLAAAALGGQPLPALPADPYSQTSNIAPGIHTRLLSEDGAVVYSLPVAQSQVVAPPAEDYALLTPEQLLARPEISTAIQGQPATYVRVVTNRRILYAAAPVQGSNGQPAGIVYLAMPLPPTGLPSGLLIELGGAALAAALAALLTGTLLARQLVTLVEAIVQAAGAVSAGDLTRQVQTGSAIRELDSLGEAFNDMTGSLRRADQAKTSFVANVTHELRTPLTVIKGTIETLEDGALDDVEGRGPLLQSMQRETDRLIRLVNDLLVLTRADAGALNLELQPLDLVLLARERCAHLSGLAVRRQVTLVVSGVDAACVMGDADRLAQVLNNLLDNAIRYSPAGATVTVAIEKGGAAEIHCAVRDCGPGIAPQHLPHIFERFYRADASRNRQTGGAGLGLAIVDALVAAQGGRTCAESNPGQGTTVHFWLPTTHNCPATADELTQS